MPRNYKARWYMNPNPMPVAMHTLNFQDVFVLAHTDNYSDTVQMFVPEGDSKRAVFVSSKTAEILMKRSVEFPIAEYTIPNALIPNTLWPTQGDTVVQHDRDVATGTPVQTAAPEGSPVSESPLTVPETVKFVFRSEPKIVEFFRGVPEFMSGFQDDIPNFDKTSRSGRSLIDMQYLYGASLGAIMQVTEDWLQPSLVNRFPTLVDLFINKGWTTPTSPMIMMLNAFLNGSLADLDSYQAQGSILRPATFKYYVMSNQFLNDPSAVLLSRSSASQQNFIINDMMSGVDRPDYDPEARLQQAFVSNIVNALPQWGLENLFSEAELKANSGSYIEALKWIELGMPEKQDRYKARIGNWGIIPTVDSAIKEFDSVEVYNYLKTNGGLMHTADQFEQVFTWSGQYPLVKRIVQTAIKQGNDAALALMNKTLVDWWVAKGGLAGFRIEITPVLELMPIHALLAWSCHCRTAGSPTAFVQTMFTSIFKPNTIHYLPYFTEELRDIHPDNFMRALYGYVYKYQETCGWSPETRSNNPLFDVLALISTSEKAKAYFTAQPHPLTSLDSFITVDCVIAGLDSAGVINASKLEQLSKPAMRTQTDVDQEQAERDAEAPASDSSFLVGADNHFRDVIKAGHQKGGSVGKYHRVKPYNPATGVHIPLLDSLNNANMMPVVQAWVHAVVGKDKTAIPLDPAIVADLDANSKHLGLKHKILTHNLFLLDGDAMGRDTCVIHPSHGGQILNIIIINSRQMVDLFGGYNTSTVLQALTHEFGHHIYTAFLKNVSRTRFEAEVKGRRLYPAGKHYGSAAQSATEQFAILSEYMVWGSSARNLYYANGASVVSDFLCNNYMSEAMLNHKK